MTNQWGCRIGRYKLKDSGLTVYNFPQAPENGVIKQRMIDGIRSLEDFEEQPIMYAGIMIWPGGESMSTWASADHKEASSRSMINTLEELIFSMRLTNHLDL